MEKYCKSCGRVFKDSDFRICPYCGKQLSTRTGRQPIPRKLRHQVFQRDGYRCRECGATNKQTRLHVDHIKPVAKGGTNDLSNLQTLCEDCNKAKYTDEWEGGSYNFYDARNQTNLYDLNNNKEKDISSKYKKCPKCNTKLVYRAEKCFNCGHHFVNSFLLSKFKKCPKCSTNLVRRAEKCFNCGYHFKN
ncbi:HNH endonuclease [uncultured Methanobrevibacter sp.]|uniref:HNH endonuclease n=1 Tax=uncultured Methanobrevibacter sp. TaxID=253161 RepID=UPI00262A1E95|nr:HNH endonuclease [uncultured Methanobrevibacter sp.]